MVRNTHQKAVVQRVILELPGHQTADSVYDAVKQEIPTIGKATVYRILNQLSEQGGLRRVQAVDRADIYDKRTDPHYHVRCTRCGCVADVELSAPIDQAAAVCGDKGFAITGHDIVFYGVCAECRQGELADA